jgi:hypothetical protein
MMHGRTYKAMARKREMGAVVTDWTPNSPHYGEAGRVSGYVPQNGTLYITFADGSQIEQHYKHVPCGDNSGAE